MFLLVRDGGIARKHFKVIKNDTPQITGLDAKQPAKVKLRGSLFIVWAASGIEMA